MEGEGHLSLFKDGLCCQIWMSYEYLFSPPPIFDLVQGGAMISSGLVFIDSWYDMNQIVYMGIGFFAYR